tara:strand:- start:2927 stop:3427 length:501 start_codon:yes stop_codon:yes gene_type:complete
LIKFSIRQLKLSDKRFIFNLYNLGVNLKKFKNKKMISFKNHSNWFSKIIDSENDIIYIANINNIKIGYIKFKIFNGSYSTISIIINPKYQNLGIGSKLLLKSLNKLNKYMNINIFYSEILKKNKISLNFFKRNGFVEVENKKNIKISYNKKNYLLIKKNDKKKFHK